MGCRDNTQKIVNIERNPKVSVSLESGSTMTDLKGVLLRGKAYVIRDDKDRLAISIQAAQSRGVKKVDFPKTVSPNLVYIEFRNFKITSWNYR